MFVLYESKDNVILQVLDTLDKLGELKWVSSPIQAISLDNTPGQGIVFVYPAYLEHLAWYSHLLLIDSTHKTNQLE